MFRDALFSLLLALSFSGGLLLPSDDTVSCRLEHGEPVDWFYLYKLPKEPSENGSTSNGLRYVYVSSADDSRGILRWNEPRFTVDHPASVPGSTINPALANASSLLTILYNDEPSNGPTDFERGHTKGVLSTDGRTGFWLIHSVPKYPPEIGTGYGYPHTGQLYGQSFLCITLDASQLETVGQQLVQNEVTVYSSRVPAALAEQFPSLSKAAQMLPVDRSGPFYSQQMIRSRGGVEFVTFAKSRQFQKELYADWIAPALDVGLLVESWQHGAGNLPSDCGRDRRHSVLNVREVVIGASERFATLKDHSKWAVDMTAASRWVCVGDINRQEHQKQRGGGSVCRMSKPVAGLYRAMVGSVEPCPKELGV
ncbi:deoxyribonuclease-2-alpha [Anopheles bellator]|uniref:deoxyribonuclease-2-alpha n=1 Tax=Anopheles bellator TaxID=139047 RepID=UPI002648B1CE|nr:deoxyribonuclease-2-alpha [Anopheles bellator]